MSFSYNNFSVILLIFFSQGMIYSLLLLKKGIENQNGASKWLSLLLFLCCLYICPFMLGYAGWYSENPTRDFMFYMPFQQLFLIGPVIYFYIQSQLNQSFKLSRIDTLHFLPAIIYFIYSLVVVITDKVILNEYYFYADERDKDLSFWYQMTGLVSMVIYLFLSLKYYERYKKIAFEVLSFADTVLFKWISRFLIAFLIILILRVVFFVINPEWGNFGSKFWYYFCFSILFFYIALNGYTNSVQTSISVNDPPFEDDDSPSQQANAFSNSAGIPTTEEKQELEQWKPKLIALMTKEKMYINPRLTLADVAEKVAMQPKFVSRIVNLAFEMNFNDFVNHYRINAVIEKLNAGDVQTKTLLAIAFECGFNSKSTFNRAFKKQTSLTPQKYLKQIPNK